MQEITDIKDELAYRRIVREARRRRRRMKKAVISAVTAVCVLFGTAAYAGLHSRTVAEAENKTDVREDRGGSLSGKIVILHSNDVHGEIDGYAKMATLKKDFETDGAEVIVADAGNFSSTDTGEDTFGALDGFMMMRRTDYNVATFGDAEFAQGFDKLRNDISGAKLRLICANVLKDDKNLIMPDYIYQTSAGKKIGFFGLTAPAECEGLTFLAGDDMYKCAGSEAESLKNDGADVVIALTHLGAEENPDGSSTGLYNKVEGIDFIIDGNSHEPMTEGAGGEPIQSAGEGFEYIGVIVFSRQGELEDHYVMSTENIESDEAVQADAERLKQHIDISEPETVSEDDITNDTIDREPVDANSDEDTAGTEADGAKAEDETSGDNAAGTKTDGKADDTKSAEVKAEEENADTAAATGDVQAADKTADESGSEITIKDGKYEVVKGDCLWSIAKKHLGDGNRWGEIYELNKGIISNPSLIYVGQQLVMPPG